MPDRRRLQGAHRGVRVDLCLLDVWSTLAHGGRVSMALSAGRESVYELNVGYVDALTDLLLAPILTDLSRTYLWLDDTAAAESAGRRAAALFAAYSNGVDVNPDEISTLNSLGEILIGTGDYAGADLPEAAVLRRWGGQAVVLPYLDGHSTTALVERSRV